MRIVLADLKGGDGFISKDTVAGQESLNFVTHGSKPSWGFGNSMCGVS